MRSRNISTVRKIKAVAAYKPTSTASFEQNIILEACMRREMPLFLTLRDVGHDGLAAAKLPSGGCDAQCLTIVVVGPGNSDPYLAHANAIQALGAHFC